jgi:hypothetical protein
VLEGVHLRADLAGDRGLGVVAAGVVPCDDPLVLIDGGDDGIPGGAKKSQ